MLCFILAFNLSIQIIILVLKYNYDNDVIYITCYHYSALKLSVNNSIINIWPALPPDFYQGLVLITRFIHNHIMLLIIPYLEAYFFEVTFHMSCIVCSECKG